MSRYVNPTAAFWQPRNPPCLARRAAIEGPLTYAEARREVPRLVALLIGCVVAGTLAVVAVGA